MINRGLGLERYRTSRLGEGGLDDFERQGRIGVFARIEARQVNGAQRAKLDGLTGRGAVGGEVDRCVNHDVSIIIRGRLLSTRLRPHFDEGTPKVNDDPASPLKCQIYCRKTLSNLYVPTASCSPSATRSSSSLGLKNTPYCISPRT